MRQIPLSDIQDAARSIYDLVVRTPLVRLELPPPWTERLAGSDIFLKLETLQPIGSFKIRGAHNVIRRLTAADARDGVWTVSAGNAAQGVAMAARAAGLRCSVMVMDTAPATKIEAIERLGASIVRASYDECWRTVETHSSDRMRGRFVHPFDDDGFIAGNGTAGLEIVEDLPDVDAVIASLGGGGLLAGVASAVRALRPSAQIFAAEPETAAPFDASLKNGRASVFERLAGIIRGWGRRPIGAADDVAAAVAAAGRVHRRVRCRGGRSHEAGGRTRHVIAEGAGSLRRRCGADRARAWENRGHRLGRQYRPAQVRVAGWSVLKWAELVNEHS